MGREVACLRDDPLRRSIAVVGGQSEDSLRRGMFSKSSSVANGGGHREGP